MRKHFLQMRPILLSVFVLFLGLQTNSVRAVEHLKSGNHRFVNGTVNHPHQTAAASKHLVAGQKPHTAILSCSDSRAAPEIIFDQGLGDMFDIRVAGNVVSNDIIASLEYAVLHLDVKTIVVMGHESCGAVLSALEKNNPQASHSHSPEGSHDLSHVNALINKIRVAKVTSKTLQQKDKRVREHSIVNVKNSIKMLLNDSKIIRKHISDGKIKLHGAIYSLETGRVDFFEHES